MGAFQMQSESGQLSGEKKESGKEKKQILEMVLFEMIKWER